VLGYTQRGGSPAPFDRLLASSFGVRAVDLLADGANRCLTAWRGGMVTHVPMEGVVTGPRFVSPKDDLVRAARSIGTYVGAIP